jgi:hypothetical protein
VTTRLLEQEECDALAAAAVLEQRDTWGSQEGPVRRVFGYLDGTPIELIWWSRSFAEQAVELLLAGEVTGLADALVHAVPLRTTGLVESWQARLTPMPDAVAHAVIEGAALAWGGFAPEGFLTIARPGETASRVEYMAGDVGRILRVVYAVNRQWPPTTKRLAERADELALKPERLAERIEEALTDADPRRALRTLAEVQLETATLAPDGPNVLRARRWLPRVIDVLRSR